MTGFGEMSLYGHAEAKADNSCEALPAFHLAKGEAEYI
jgi:hypothetical protein